MPERYRGLFALGLTCAVGADTVLRRVQLTVERVAQELGEVALEALTVVVGEGSWPLRATARAADLLLLVADEQLHVDGGLVVDVPAHADGRGAAAEHHAGKADVLRDHHVAGLQALDDGEVRAVGAAGDIEGLDPKAGMRGVAPAGVLGVARVVAADAPGEVLRGVSGDEHGDARRACAGERLACDRARVGVDDEGGHGGFLSNAMVARAKVLLASVYRFEVRPSFGRTASSSVRNYLLRSDSAASPFEGIASFAAFIIVSARCGSIAVYGHVYAEAGGCGDR